MPKLKPRQQQAVNHYRQHGGVVSATHHGIYCARCHCHSYQAYGVRTMEQEQAFLAQCTRLDEAFHSVHTWRVARRMARYTRFAHAALNSGRFANAAKACERAERMQEELSDIANGVGPVFFRLT
jgi:hypothetical protein